MERKRNTLWDFVKIALVILHADPSRGGAERYTVDLAAALSKRGHEVTLVATSFAGVPDGVGQALLATNARSRLGQYRQFLDQLDAHLGDVRYDVVHAMLPVRSCDLYHPHAGLAAEAIETGHLKHDAGLVREMARWANRLNRKRRSFAAVERELLGRGEKSPVVLCLSDYVKGAIRNHYDLPESKLATLFNAVDLKRFNPERDRGAGPALRKRMGIADERVVGLMIAQDFARKGLRQAIVALAQPELRDSEVTLIVVGKGEVRPYESLAKELGVADRVIFAGPTADPYPFYSAADFFVLPTRHDPCSLVVLEALAMGVPVISTLFNGACEIMTDGVHGRILSDPGDVAKLAQAMLQLLNKPSRQAAKQACTLLRPRLSFDSHLDQLVGLYKIARAGALVR